jgi:soluble lytic murein transglycosylase-like protein
MASLPFLPNGLHTETFHFPTENASGILPSKCARCLRFLLILSLAMPAAWAEKTAEVDPLLRDRLAHALADEYDDTDKFDAEVWLRVSDQRLQRYIKDQTQRLELLKYVYRDAKLQRLDPDLVLAVIQTESAFDQFAVSSVGAQGLMQVMPFWRFEMGRPQDNLTHVETNVRYGTVILAHYIDVAKDDLVEALARYNGSFGKIKYPDKVITAWRQHWRNKTRDELPR